MRNWLIIQNLSVSVEGKTVVAKVNLTVKLHEIHALMGPNGSGKTSLAMALLGNSNFHVDEGKATLADQDILSLKTNERAKMGLFLSFQNPTALTGVSLGQLIFSSYKSINGKKKIDINKLYLQMKKTARLLGLKENMLERDIHDGFSGGEKKKAEMLILLILKPKFIIFDEIDSGLDVDTLRLFAQVINKLTKKQVGIILITHNQKVLQYIKPDFVHILKEGRVVKTGNQKLVKRIEQEGYANF